MVHIGTRRSPLYTPAAGGGLRAGRSRGVPGFRLVGVMGYEGQIAGLGDAPPGHPVRAQLIRRHPGPFGRRTAPAADRGSPPDPGPDQPGVRERRRDRQPGVDRPGRVGDRADRGFWAGRPDPVRRVPPVSAPIPRCCSPCPWCAGRARASPRCSPAATSPPGPGPADRLPRPYLPAGLTLTGVEGAGEVQTPVRGAAAGRLRPGDRVWLRHAKAGELAERFTDYHVLRRRRTGHRRADLPGRRPVLRLSPSPATRGPTGPAGLDDGEAGGGAWPARCRRPA